MSLEKERLKYMPNIPDCIKDVSYIHCIKKGKKELIEDNKNLFPLYLE